MKEKDIQKHLEKVEKYILGELPKGKLDCQIISIINADEGRIWKVRRLLEWILTGKYIHFEADRDDLDMETQEIEEASEKQEKNGTTK